MGVPPARSFLLGSGSAAVEGVQTTGVLLQTTGVGASYGRDDYEISSPLRFDKNAVII